MANAERLLADLQQRNRELLEALEARHRDKAINDPDYCQGCGGRYRFDTSIESTHWNAIIRANDLPEYLCTACILREFVKRQQGFTARLWGDEFHGTEINVRIVKGSPALPTLLEKLLLPRERRHAQFIDDLIREKGGAAHQTSLAQILTALTEERSRCVELEAALASSGVGLLMLPEKIEEFRLYCANCARSKSGSGNYGTSDLCVAQERAIRQLQEYLDPKCDGYLIALVKYHADRERALLASSGVGIGQSEDGWSMVEEVVAKFEASEAAGYHTRDREYALTLLRKALEMRGIGQQQSEEKCGVVGEPEAGRCICELPKGHEGYHQQGGVRWLGYHPKVAGVGIGQQKP